MVKPQIRQLKLNFLMAIKQNTINLFKVSSQVVYKDLNPIWNFRHKCNLDIVKEKYQKLVFNVKDYDKLKNDMIGKVEIDWMPCFENPKEW